MLKSRSVVRRCVTVFLWVMGSLLLLPRAASAQQVVPSASLPPLRVQNLAVGTRCFGYLPCTDIDPFGLRLRVGALAVFRPEKGHDRDFYAARLQIMPALTLMKWAEVGVAIPITLYKKDIGVSAVFEPLEPYGRLRIPLEAWLGGITTTAAVRVRVASGPFVGGLPPLPAGMGSSSSMPDFMSQAVQAYRQQTEFDVSLALGKRIGRIAASGSIGASVAPEHVEIYGGGELALRAFGMLQAFVQGQGIGIPKCRADEAALNFCARGFRFAAGVRFDWDIGAGGVLIGTGSGAVEPGWAVGAQLGIDYDENVRHMHGDGVEAAHAWWDRRFEAMARGWAEWKSAAVVWADDEAARRVLPPRHGPFSDLIPGGIPESSPWLDGLLGEIQEPEPLIPEVPGAAGNPALGGKSPRAQQGAARPSAVRKPHRKDLFAEVNRRAAAKRQLERMAEFKLPSSLDLMTDEELAREQLKVFQEELRRAEQQQWRDSPALPPMEKAMLNWVATAPARAVLGLLAMSGPGRRAEAEEQMRKLRPLKCTPAEEDACEAVEQLLDMAGTMLAPSAAEATVARQATLALARQGAHEAGRVAEFAAAEQAIGLAEEGAATPSGPRLSAILDRLPPRLNPMNYECCGLGSNFGNIRFRPPTTSASATTGTAEAATPEAVHSAEAWTAPKPQFGSSHEQKLADLLKQRGHTVEPNPMEGVEGAGRQFDAYVDGTPTEFKSLQPGADSNRIRHRVNESIRRGGQSSDMIFDARGSGLTQEEAERGVRRAMGIARGKIERITIFGDDYIVTN